MHSKDELARLKKLYSQATSTTLSQKERNKAVKELQKLYPDYLGKLSAEQILVGKAQTAYDNLRTSIIEAAKARAAQDKIVENQGAIIDIEMNIDGLKERRKELEKELAEAEERIGFHQMKLDAMSVNSYSADLNIQNRAMQNLKRQKAEILIDMYAIDKQLSDMKRKSDDLEKASEQLDKRYVNPVTPTASGVKLEETEEQRKERLKREREQRRQEREALKEDLEEQKKIRDLAEVDNLTRYTTGLINFRQYNAGKERIEREYLDNQKRVHEKHGKSDSADSAAVLLKEAELKRKANENFMALDMELIDQRRALAERQAYDAYYDPSGPLFLNQKALNQRLLELDEHFLKEKRDKYDKGSKEWAVLNRQYCQLIADDQREKQRETAEAMAEFEKRYRKSEGSERQRMETAVLDSLHKKGLVSEEEYQKALADIRRKYRGEDIEKARTVQSEHADMILNLQTSWTDLFDSMGDKSGEFWNNLADAASAAYAFLGAAMSQYSAYADASRDLEVAKIEKRYDAEIKAAGKNTKKTEQLEKKKAADIAKVKKKYNDRAMKMELAQAVAQTAVAAINAYASGSKVNVWLGPVAAAMATAAGMVQIAAIKKQHEAQAMGYYSGGFTDRDPDNRREVGVVHANEFVANHKAVANPALSPVLRLIDNAQKSNTVGSLTADDVANAIGRSPGVSPRGGAEPHGDSEAVRRALELIAGVTASTRQSIDRLSDNLEGGITADVVMDGERGFHKKYERFKRLIDNPKR